MPTPRIVLLSSGLGYVTRGVEVWMQELHQHWPAAAGSLCELWTGAPIEHPKPYQVLHGLGRDHAWLRGRSWGRRYELEQLSVLPETIWRLRRQACSVVYCGDPVLSWHLKRFQRWHGARVVFMNGMRLGHRWANHFDGVHLLMDSYLAQAHAELGTRRQAHFFVAPHFTDTHAFQPPSPQQRAQCRRDLGLPSEGFLALTVGPLGAVSGKRTDFLATEIARCPATVHLVHVGDEEDGGPELRRAITSQLASRVHFLGRLERHRMPAVYAAADVYMLAALAEPFSIAIAEALASGLPVVHHPDPVTLAVSGPGGFPVSMQQPGAAAALLQSLLAQPALLANHRHAARQWAVERYSPPVIARTIAEELRQISLLPFVR